MLCLLLLRRGHLRQGLDEPAAGTTQNGQRHLQIAPDPFECGGLRRLRLPLCFQKQLRLAENALANHARALAPGRIKLRGLPCIAATLHEYSGHPLAVFGAGSRHRHQMLHGDLRAETSFADLLLDGFGQQFDERQPPRYPAHAAVEPVRQFVERIAETLFHLRQQPALFERAFLRAHALRARQQQGFGFAQGPDGGFDGVAPQLPERGGAFVTVDHQIAVAAFFRHHDDDGCLLPALSQRRQQMTLAVRLANAQMFPPQVELMKLQLHGLPAASEYAGVRDRSFAGTGEVCG